MFPVAFGAAPSTLLTGLSAFWNCDEAAATDSLADSLGVTNLTDINTPGVAAGLISGCRTFAVGSSQYFTATDPAAVRTTGNTFSASFWFKTNGVANLGQTYSILNKQDLWDGYRTYFSNQAGDYKVLFRLGGGGAETGIEISTGGSAPVEWIHVYIEYDSGTNSMYMRARSSVLVLDVSAGPTVLTNVFGSTLGLDFYIGSAAAGTTTFDGFMDMIGFWNGRVLTSDEQDELYNAGAGRQYPF